MAKKKTATAETVFASLMADYSTLSEAEQRKLRELIQDSSSLASGAAAFMIIERGLQNMMLRKKHSDRGGKEYDPKRNDAIVAERATLTLGQLAKKYKLSVDAVRGVLKRRKKKQLA